VQPKAPPFKPPQPAAAKQSAPAALESIPWGSALRTTGKSRGLRFTTTAQVVRTASGLQLAIEVELHNSTRAPMKVSLHPPLILVTATSRDCRPGRLSLEVLDAIVVQPASPDGVPSIVAVSLDVARK
jgi:hypothetical protein